MKYLTTILILTILVSGCNSAYYLRRAKLNTARAIALGAKVNTDTVYKEVKINVPVPGKDTSTVFTPSVNEKEFSKAIHKYDSLLRNVSDNNVGDIKTITIYRDRFRQAFEKDTTFYFQLENNAVVALDIRKGTKFKYHLRYQRKPEVKVFVKTVPVSTDTTIKSGWSVPWWLWLILAILALLAIFGKALIKKI